MPLKCWRSMEAIMLSRQGKTIRENPRLARRTILGLFASVHPKRLVSAWGRVARTHLPVYIPDSPHRRPCTIGGRHSQKEYWDEEKAIRNRRRVCSRGVVSACCVVAIQYKLRFCGHLDTSSGSVFNEQSGHRTVSVCHRLTTRANDCARSAGSSSVAGRFSRSSDWCGTHPTWYAGNQSDRRRRLRRVAETRSRYLYSKQIHCTTRSVGFYQ